MDSDPLLVFEWPFAFDLNGFSETSRQLFGDIPLPSPAFVEDCTCSRLEIPLPMSEPVRIGSFDLKFPRRNGGYVVDLLNADETAFELCTFLQADALTSLSR